jgi:hypothetical protein
MLVCNVSLRPPRLAIAATIAEIATAADATTVGAVFEALVDDPASATDSLAEYLGEFLSEAASAADSFSTVGTFDAEVIEAAAAVSAQDGVLPVAYATYDGLATNVTISNGGLTALHHNTTTNSGVISTAFESSGKYYFECTVQTSTTASNFLGIMASTWASVFSATQMTTLSTSVQLGGTSTIYSNGGSTGKALGATAVGDVYSFAIDLTADLAWIRRNGGNWNNDGAADPATGVGGVVIAAGSFAPIVRFAAAAAGTDQVTGNFGQSSFVYTAPSGFGNWPA